MASSELPLRDVYATWRRIMSAAPRKPSTGPREHGRQALLSTGAVALSDHAAELARSGACDASREAMAAALKATRRLGGVQGPLRNVLDLNRAAVRAACPRRRK